jgi:hypothetical protein
VHASEAHDQPTSEYNVALYGIRGAINSMGMVAESCSELMPETSDANTRAYQDWRTEYAAFLREIEQRYADLLLADRDSEKQARLLRDARAESNLRQLVRSGIKENGQMCKVFPTFLNSADGDIEHSNVEMVAIIRRRPLLSR